jgi:cyclohexyl-isocyanide hydratase
LRQQGATAKWGTAVCTGSHVRGAAGLLEGYRATSHWAYVDLLPTFGARYEKGRVVVDRNRITGGGVTAGIDFGLRLVAELAGEETAKAIQLGLEYDPEPPFNSGHPDVADAQLVASVRARIAARWEEAKVAAERAAQSMRTSDAVTS